MASSIMATADNQQFQVSKWPRQCCDQVTRHLPHLASLIRFNRCFRLNHTLTQYLVIFGSLIFFFCLYYGGYHRLLSAVLLVNSSSSVDDRAKNVHPVEQLTIDTNTKFRPPITTTTAAAKTTTINKPSTSTITNSIRPTTVNPSLSAMATFKSTCSAAADGRGPSQKVIGYSMYGKNFSEPNFYNLYLKSFTETLRTLPVKYPGWVVRIYHELKSDDVESWKVVDKVLDLGPNVSRAHIDLCNATQIIKDRKLGDLFEMTWRWLPMLDELVDVLMSRDSDSAIYQREMDAVAEWLASNRTFHIMRDHPQHCLFFVGCCWGVKINQSRAEIVAIGQKMFAANHEHRKGYDQDLLINYFRPLASQSLISHDSYCCGGFASQPFPTPRVNYWFVGAPLKTPVQTLNVPCPEQCRPHNLTGPLAQANWTLC